MSVAYRKALEHLDQVARGLYDGLDVEQLEVQEPGLRDHVLLRMLELAQQRKPLPPMLRSARVFQEIRGGLVSLERLEGTSRPSSSPSTRWCGPARPSRPSCGTPSESSG